MKRKIAITLIINFSGYVTLFAQNIAVNTAGTAAASTNMFEVTQTSAAANMVALYAIHSGATGAGLTGYGLQAIKTGGAGTNIAGYFSATGSTGANYSIIVPNGGGYAGIGISAPVAQLHIMGTIDKNMINERVTSLQADLGGIIINRRARGTIGALTTVLNGDQLGKYMFAGYDGTNYLITAQIDAVANGAIAAGSIPTDITFSTGSTDLGYTEKMRIMSGGNVGIGTSAPGSILQVRTFPVDLGSFPSTTTGAFIKSQNNNGGSTPSAAESVLTLAREGISAQAYANFADFKISRWANVGVQARTQLDLGLTHGNGDATTTNIMTWRSDGNVGIGTTAPGAKLQVNTSTANDGVLITGASSQNLGIFTNAGPGAYNPMTQSGDRSIIVLGASQNNPGGGLVLAPWRSNAGGIRIDANGKVGVGISTPGSMLHVYSTDPALQVGTYLIHAPAITANNALNMHAAWSELDLTTSFNFSGDNYGAVNRVTATAGQTGTVNQMIGSINDIGHAGTGTLTNGIGAMCNIGNYAGTITNAYGVSAMVLNSGVAINNSYGVYTGAIQGTNKWSFYASDAAAQSFFAGNVGIGKSVTTINAKLDVEVGVQDGIAFYQPVDNTMALQGYIDGQWSNRTTYAGGCCNYLLLQPDVGRVGIGTNAPTALLSVNGAANNTTGAWGIFSDARIKTIDSDFTDGLDIIKQIHPIRFHYNSDAPFTSDQPQIGIVAQELEKIAPYMVERTEFKDMKDLRQVNNQAYTFLLINAVKEQQNIIESLKAENLSQKKQIENLSDKFIQLESTVKTLQLQLSTEVKK